MPARHGSFAVAVHDHRAEIHAMAEFMAVSRATAEAQKSRRKGNSGLSGCPSLRPIGRVRSRGADRLRPTTVREVLSVDV